MKSPCVGPENAPSSDVFGHNPNRGCERYQTTQEAELNAPRKHLGDDHDALNRSIPALYQCTGRHGGIPDCLPGLGRGDIPIPADARRQRIAAPRSGAGLAGSKP